MANVYGLVFEGLFSHVYSRCGCFVHQLAAAMTLLVVKRNHVSADIYRQYQRKHGVNALFLPPTIQVSSTQIREMSMPKTGLDRIDAYIKTHGLYR